MHEEKPAEDQETPDIETLRFDFSKIRRVKSKNFTTAHADRVLIGVSSASLRFLFTRNDLQTNTEDSEIIHEAEIYMAPKDAYDFCLFLYDKLKECRDQQKQFPQDLAMLDGLLESDLK